MFGDVRMPGSSADRCCPVERRLDVVLPLPTIYVDLSGLRQRFSIRGDSASEFIAGSLKGFSGLYLDFCSFQGFVRGIVGFM